MRVSLRAAPLVLALLAACSADTTAIPDGGRGSAGRDAESDAGQSDGGAPIDGGAPRDGGAPIDGGLTPDGGAPIDGGAPRDGGAPIDGGLTPDGGDPDGGTADDGGPDAGRADAGLPSACSDDRECAPRGWCRPTMSGDRRCAEWVRESEICGGFVAPWSAERCAPGLSCVNPQPLIPDLPGRCVVEATLAELARDPARYDGRAVGVLEAFVVATAVNCTRIACTMQNPCCNTCTATEQLAERAGASTGLAMIDPAGMSYGCRGTECDWRDMCALAPDQRHRVIGTFRAGPPAVLEVHTIEPIP